MPNNVASPSAAVEKMRPDWALSRALLGGTRAMREARELYLPRWPNEESAAYEARRKTAVLFPAYKRTVETLAAKPFSKPLSIDDDTPDDVQGWLDDIDLEGRNVDVFGAGLMEDCLGYGLCGILVDFPDAADAPASAAGIRTQADERAAGLRPYWVHIRPWQILGWRASRQAGAWVLSQLRLLEEVEEEDGDHGTMLVQQVRVLEPGRFTVYRKRTDVRKEEWIVFAEGTTTLPYVPFVPCYGKRTGFLTAEPPLIEVANLNVAHWQSASDQQTILHVARVPILTVTGVQDGIGPNGEAIPWTFTVGASAAVKLPISADMKFVEHSGKAIEAGAAELEALEERMRQAGAELLVIAPGKVTATQVHSDNAVAMSALQRITLSLQDELNMALKMTADWVGAESGGNVSLFRDFGAATLAEASAELLLNTTQAGYLSAQTYISELKRRGIVSEEIDHEEEAERIAEEGPRLGLIGATGNANSE